MTVFYFPPSVLGKNVPPDGSFIPFLANWFLLFIPIMLIVVLLPKRWLPKTIGRTTLSAAFVVNTAGLLWTLMKFD